MQELKEHLDAQLDSLVGKHLCGTMRVLRGTRNRHAGGTAYLISFGKVCCWDVLRCQESDCTGELYCVCGAGQAVVQIVEESTSEGSQHYALKFFLSTGSSTLALSSMPFKTICWFRSRQASSSLVSSSVGGC